MDQVVHDPISQAEISAVHKIVAEATCAKPPTAKAGREFQYPNRLTNVFVKKGNTVFVVMLVLAALMLLFGGVSMLVSSQLLKTATVVMATLAVFSGVIVVVLSIAADVPVLLKLFREPYSTHLAAVETSAMFDLQFVERLSVCEQPAVKYVLAYYRYERNGLEKRGGLLSGSIEKIGLFPALAAVAGLWYALSAINAFNGWLLILVPLIVAFHFMNAAAFFILQRMDRVIAMLELTLALRK